MQSEVTFSLLKDPSLEEEVQGFGSSTISGPRLQCFCVLLPMGETTLGERTLLNSQDAIQQPCSIARPTKSPKKLRFREFSDQSTAYIIVLQPEHDDLNLSRPHNKFGLFQQRIATILPRRVTTAMSVPQINYLASFRALVTWIGSGEFPIGYFGVGERERDI